MVSRINRELADADIARIADTYHAWRGEDGDLKPYEDVPGFCASATLDTIREHQYVLTPGRYVGSEAVRGRRRTPRREDRPTDTRRSVTALSVARICRRPC